MDILLFNLSWMPVNIFLALVPVVFTGLILQFKKWNLVWILYFFWFIFLPNTIYTVTDLPYSLKQFSHVSGITLIFLFLLQYAVLALIGILAYFYSMQPLELLIKKVKKGQRRNIIIAVNFLIAFAITLGKIQRTESWYLITQPGRVIHDVLTAILSPFSLIFFITAGLVINGIYFLVKKHQWTKKMRYFLLFR